MAALQYSSIAGFGHVIMMMCKIQGVKSAVLHEMEESPYCITLHAITRERYKQSQTNVGCDPYFMKRSDFSTQLRFFLHSPPL